MMILRPATDGQTAITLDVITAEAAATLGARFAAIDPWLSYPFPAAALTAYFGDKEACAPRYIILSGDAIAGAVGLRQNWLRGPYLQFLGLLPSYQSQGLGQSVLAWFEGTARARGERNLWVAASEFNTDGLRFYEGHGFSRVALLDDLVRAGMTEILLRKRL